MDRIETAETWYGKPEDAKVEHPATWVPLQAWAVRPGEIYEPPARGELEVKKTWAHAYIEVYVNHGRWVAECPHCRAAQVASVTDKRFLCVLCHNIAFEGQWLEVKWPNIKVVAQIEAILLARPFIENRHWTPSETVAGLRQENLDHGCMESV